MHQNLVLCAPFLKVFQLQADISHIKNLSNVSRRQLLSKLLSVNSLEKCCFSKVTEREEYSTFSKGRRGETNLIKLLQPEQELYSYK